MYKTNQQVAVYGIGQTFSFKENETIHTENSYKYTLEQIQDLTLDCGFQPKKNFLDKKVWFDLAFLSLQIVFKLHGRSIERPIESVDLFHIIVV